MARILKLREIKTAADCILKPSFMDKLFSLSTMQPCRMILFSFLAEMH